MTPKEKTHIFRANARKMAERVIKELRSTLEQLRFDTATIGTKSRQGDEYDMRDIYVDIAGFARDVLAGLPTLSGEHAYQELKKFTAKANELKIYLQTHISTNRPVDFYHVYKIKADIARLRHILVTPETID